MSNSRRWWIDAKEANGQYPVEVMPVAEHEKLMAEKDAEIESLKEKRDHAGRANHQAWEAIRLKDIQLRILKEAIERSESEAKGE